MKVGQKIKTLREIRNYTQDYMASSLDLSTTAYGKIERDETEVTLTRIEQIAKILETNVGNILEFDPAKIYNITHADNAAMGNNNVYYNDLLIKQFQEEASHLRKENSTLLQKIFELLNRLK